MLLNAVRSSVFICSNTCNIDKQFLLIELTDLGVCIKSFFNVNLSPKSMNLKCSYILSYTAAHICISNVIFAFLCKGPLDVRLARALI